MITLSQHVWIYDSTVFTVVAYLVVVTYLLIAMLSVARLLFIDNSFTTMFGIECTKKWIEIWLNYAVDKVFDYGGLIVTVLLNAVIYVAAFFVISLLTIIAAIIFTLSWVFGFRK